MAQTRSPATIDALTGIRGLAAAWVVAFHLRGLVIQFFPGARTAANWMSTGYLGVDLFFVLSGFVLSLNYQERFSHFGASSYFRFLALRLARIYPVHLAITAAFVAGVWMAKRAGANFGNPAECFLNADLARHLTLTHAWGGVSSCSWNFPSWSISAEWAAYLCFPPLAAVLCKLPRGWPLLLLAAGAYALMLWVVAVHYANDLDLTMTGGLVRVAGGFVAGCLLCSWYASSPAQSRLWDLIAMVTSAIIVAVCWWLPHASWVVSLFGVLILALAKARGPLSNWLGGRLMRYLGRVSYAFYMVHAVVILRLNANDYMHLGAIGRASLIVGMVVGAWAAAHALHVGVEEPCRERIRQWMARIPDQPAR